MSRKTRVRFSGAFCGPPWRVVYRKDPEQRSSVFRGEAKQREAEGSKKATAMWQWCNLVHSKIPEGRLPLLVNFDETSVRLFTEGSTGHLSKGVRQRARSGAPVGRRVSRATTRACITHLAVVCNDLAVQQCLPQVLIVGKQQVSEARLASLKSSVP